MKTTAETQRFQRYISREGKDTPQLKYWCPYYERMHQHGFVGETEFTTRLAHCLDHGPVAGQVIEIALPLNTGAVSPAEPDPTPLLDRIENSPPRFYKNLQVRGMSIRKAVKEAILIGTVPHGRKK